MYVLKCFFFYLPVYLLSARAMHIFCNDPLLPLGLSLTPRTLDICVIVFLLEFAQGVFCDWCPPKIHKYGKPRGPLRFTSMENLG